MPNSSLSWVLSGIGSGIGIGSGVFLVRRVLPRDDEDDLDRFDRLLFEDDDFLAMAASLCF